MQPSSNPFGQHCGVPATTNSQLDEQTLIVLSQQLGLYPQLLQSAASTTHRGQEPLQQQQNDFIKELLIKMQMGSAEEGCQNQTQQQPKLSNRGDTPRNRRPSLMHDYGTASAQHNPRYSLMQQFQSDKRAANQTVIPSDKRGQGTSFVEDPQEAEDERNKRRLNEQLERIDRDKSKAAALLQNAQRKVKACETILRQEGAIVEEEKDDGNESDDAFDGQSPTDALIERIYAENRRKATTTAIPPLQPTTSSVNNYAQIAEDSNRLAEEYERGIELLPALVQAMRIQRDRRQEALESRRIIYEEQLVAWEKKVAAYEKSQKKLARDVKNKELFEKTFVELKKMREEKERNSRVERSRISLAQGGNGISSVPATSEAVPISFINSDSAPDDNDGETVDEKAYSAAIVPPLCETRPRRFFDNRNGLVENALAETRTQLEAFQNNWTDVEKTVFIEKMVAYGKNFAAIAAFLPHKSVRDCVQFYYMTKKRNNYKQKFGRRRKKIGRQGYRPPVMPRFGDENVQLENYGRGCTYVECLLCSTRILVLESLSQQQHFDPFALSQATFSHQHQIPVCTKCQGIAQRSRTLNRCPLGICTCVGGKRKMRPVRNLPEKFASLSVEHKRFLIHRLKIPPSTNKCCTNCFKRISKDIEDLLLGELSGELESFNNRPLVHSHASGNGKPTLLVEKAEDDDDFAETKPEMDEIWMDEEGPPQKEMKLEPKERLDMMEEGKSVVEGSARFQQQGSITKGLPNRTRNTLIGTRTKTPEQTIAPDGVADSLKELTGLDIDFASKILAQFGVLPSTGDSRTAGDVGWTSELIDRLQGQNLSAFQGTNAPLQKASTSSIEGETSERRNSESLRRKSGLATAILPSPVVEGGNNNRMSSRSTASPLTLTPRKQDSSEGDKVQPKGTEEQPALPPESNCALSSSCYESLSDDSDTEKEDKLYKETSTGSTTGVSLNFFSLFDFMEEDERTEVLPDKASTSFAPVLMPHSLPTAAASSQLMPGMQSEKGNGECVYEPLSEDEA